MRLQTKIPLTRVENQIDYDSRLLFLGSCFAKNMSDKLAYFKFQGIQNPFGILFHPLAIKNLVSRAVYRRPYLSDEVFYWNERWQCFDAHSDLSATSPEGLLRNLNAGLDATLEQIGKATHIIITLGTAWAYRYKKSGQFVASCHKVPQKEFSKELISVASIGESLRNVVAMIRSINQNVEVVFTVSPVRHLKDGFVENQRSKAHLLTAVHTLSGEREEYFPAYEIMMDELRDYRFYDTDMIHPNPLAIDYIWEKFKYVWISETTYPIMEKVAEV
ncbi:MAG TPA: GSCFA domain-containing protein, partial [Arenibacter sp.]|nr:GSCFA domain-containing protein [Arenibacter sp.]